MIKKLFEEEYPGLKLKCQIIREKSNNYAKINVKNSADIAKLLEPLKRVDKEQFVLVLLNNKNIVIGINTVYIGQIDSIYISPREIVKIALLSNSRSIIISHNHLSDDPNPSAEDKDTTQKLKSVLTSMDIKLLDHIIVAPSEYYSFADNNLL